MAVGELGRDIFKLAELFLIFGAIGGVLVWQWWQVRPSQRGTPPTTDADSPPPWWARR